MKKNMRKIGFTLLTAFIGGAVAVGAYKLIENKHNESLSFEERQKVYFANNPMPVISSADNPDFTQAAAITTPAVVHIKTTYSGTTAQGPGGDPMEDMFDEFFRRGRPQGPQMASGSGVIITPDGYIMTNNHVVENASKIEVVLNDKRSFDAKVIGTDPNTDLALIKVSSSNLPIVKLGNSDNVQVGEWVLAVGNPFNLTSTVTAGIVSAKGRSIGILGDRADETSRPIEAFIQTDAAINRGNSGGALVNTKGELIGINAAIASQTGNYEGYGFAIPVNLAKKVMDDFIKFGSVQRGYLGVSIGDVTAEVAKEKGLASTQGVIVASVVEGGAAEAAGIHKDDVITKIAGVRVNSSAELQEQIGRHAPGDKVSVTLIRGGAERNIDVTLRADKQLALAASNKAASVKSLGASFRPLTAAQKSRFKISSGVVVSDVTNDGLFSRYDIPKGLIITTVNGRSVNSSSDVSSAIGSSKDGMVRINGFDSDGSRVTISFPVR